MYNKIQNEIDKIKAILKQYDNDENKNKIFMSLSLHRNLKEILIEEFIVN